MRVRVTRVMDGPGPFDAIVSVQKKEGGQEEVIVNKRLIRDNTIEVAKIGDDATSVLVELPQESVSGSWRIWVDSKSVT